MTFQYRTMLQLEQEVQFRYSVSGVTQRFTSGSGGRIRDMLNISWQKLRELIALASDGSYLLGTTPANLPIVAAVTGEVYAEIDWPLDAIAIYGVRVKVNQNWYPLKRAPWSAYQDEQIESLFPAWSSTKGPIAYTPRLIGTNAVSTETVGKIMIWPVPTSGVYRLWYLQAWAPQTADAATFPGTAAFHEWAVLDTLCMMVQPDGNARKQYELFALERQKSEERIVARASQFDNGLAITARDGRFDGQDPDYYGGAL